MKASIWASVAARVEVMRATSRYQAAVASMAAAPGSLSRQPSRVRICVVSSDSCSDCVRIVTSAPAPGFVRAERRQHGLGDVAYGHRRLRLRPDIQRPRQARIGTQRLNVDEIAAEAVKNVLPRPNAVRIAQQRRFAARDRAHDVRHQPVLGIVAAADDVAAPSRSNGCAVGEVRVRHGVGEDFRRRL